MSRCRPEKWFMMGAIPLAVVALLVIVGLRSSIERELAARSNSALEAAGLPWAAVKFKGLDGTLVGNALSENEKRLSLSTVSGVWGVQRISDRASLVERVSPFTWWAIRSEGKLRIKGHVMSSDVRRIVQGVAEASFPGETIDDRMALASGSLDREDWLAAVSFALVQLTNLKEGTARLVDMTLTIKGEAAGFGEYDAIRSAMNSDLPSGVRIVDSAVLPPTVEPFAWTVTIRGTSVTLDGHVPGKDVREVLHAAASALVTDAVLVDRARIAGGAPKHWLAAVRVGLEGLGRLKNGQLAVSGKTVRLSGETDNEDEAVSIRNAILKSLPEDYVFIDEISIKEAEVLRPATSAGPSDISDAGDGHGRDTDREDTHAARAVATDGVLDISGTDASMREAAWMNADECQLALDRILTQNTIRFEPESAELQAHSRPILTQLAHVARLCPNRRIEISGHADSDGNRDFNLRLSQLRAESVVRFLVNAGVERVRLDARGYGSDRPVQPNNSEAAKAANRRIEFIVKSE